MFLKEDILEIKGLELFEEVGIIPNAERMSTNGEIRLRLGSDYIRTLKSGGGWQNAHFHRGVKEFYAVVSGWMAFAEEVEGQLSIKIVKAGESVESQPDHVHNVYLPVGADIHTVKYGASVGNPDKNGADWWPADEAFNAATKAISEVELLARDQESIEA